jgi:hypothetical protein
MARNPTLGEIIRRTADGRMLDVRTTMAGEIVTYNAGTRRATVRPGVRVQGVDGDSTPEVDTLADIPDVPVWFPGGAAFSQFWTLLPGDPVRIEWSEEDDLAFYDSTKSIPLTPEILRKHGASCVCRPEGDRGAPATKLTSISSDGTKILLGDALGLHYILTEVFISTLSTLVTAASAAAVAGDGGVMALNTLATALNTLAGAPIPVSLTKAKGT